MDKLKIVVVGGGSVAWAPDLVRDMLLTPALAEAEFVLLDIDLRAAELTKAFLVKLAGELGVPAAFVATDRRQAMEGAQYVVITITTGGLDAMEKDILIPEEFGIYHTVGDTSGPGGWSRLIRNFEVFAGLAKDISRYAPGAVVLNYTNPMTSLTDVLNRLYRGPVVGLCHGLFDNLRLIQELYGLEREDEVNISYGGLNHFFWATKIRAGGVDVLRDLEQRLETGGFTELEASVGRLDEHGKPLHRDVATELFRLTGVMPYLGDEHTSEFFSCYITSRANMEKYHLNRKTIARRRARFDANRARLEQMVQGEIEPSYRRRTRETAADIIAAHWQGRVFIDVGNLPNIGQIANLPTGLVVETAIRVDRNGFTPLTHGPLPCAALGCVEPYAQLFPMTVDACLQNNKKLALQALRLDPVCAHLNGEQVVAMGERLLAAHRQFVPAF